MKSNNLLRHASRCANRLSSSYRCMSSITSVTTSSITSSISLTDFATRSTRTPNQHVQKVQKRNIYIENKLKELNITLPSPSSPKANYNIICHTTGNMMYISGHLPIQHDGTLLTGRVGPESGGRTVEEGYEAARYCGLNIISTLKEQLGDLDRVEQIVKVFGIVNSTTDFKHQHLVMDGCSDVLMEVFGKPIGYHARSAIGTSTLPLDMVVEVEAIVQIKPE